ncbi:MAG: hypothetical protein JWQ90_1679 [Hydrocarboniphaga sp.]|uniref:sensor domain-containing diguanylate cyclase n=1 Tax=Hydrocarboniphaga sp. TaxID=2033016 RepID=UPI00260E8A50|nr:diguanylate cyclase [Hydrocarboniphaga sp.]MDB5969229.1 hypothetical protein [Hydrocarboniphaga sp.]
MNGSSFLPHGYCIAWNPALLWTFVISDTAIGLAYFSIPLALIHFARQKPAAVFNWIFALFGFFISACGTTHFIDVLNIWHPVYHLDAAARAITALASVVTAAALWPLLPKALALFEQQADSQLAQTDANDRLNASLQLLAERNRQVEESERRFRLTLQHSPIGLAVVAPHGSFISVNHALCSIVGYSEQELLVLSFQNITHPEDLEGDLDLLHQVLDGWRETFRMEKRYIHKLGHEVRIQLDVSLLRDEAGQPLHFIAQIQDITERHEAQQDLRRLAAEVEDLYDNAPCGYHTIDENGVFLRVNQTELQWLGYARHELVGRKTLADLLDAEGVSRFRETFAQLKAEGHISGVEYQITRKDGSRFPIMLAASAITDAAGRYLRSRGTIVDITERKRLERELERQARTDVLTGVHNRRHFMDLAAQEVARVRRSGGHVSVLMLDLDHFKSVNDNYGHQTGDMILCQAAGIAVRSMREMDTVCRVGGEEFAILLPGTDRQRAVSAAERLCEAIAMAPISMPDGGSLRITASVGVAVCDQTDADVDVLLKRADIGLYAAKGSGRNRVCLPEDRLTPTG